MPNLNFAELMHEYKGVGVLHHRYIDPEGQSTGSWNFGTFVNFPQKS